MDNCIYTLEYMDSKGVCFGIKAICTTKESANKLLHQWFDSEMSTYEKNLEIKGVIAIDVYHPERSVAQISCEKLKQWKEMTISIRELDEWLWIKPKVIEYDDEL